MGIEYLEFKTVAPALMQSLGERVLIGSHWRWKTGTRRGNGSSSKSRSTSYFHLGKRYIYSPTMPTWTNLKNTFIAQITTKPINSDTISATHTLPDTNKDTPSSQHYPFHNISYRLGIRSKVFWEDLECISDNVVEKSCMLIGDLPIWYWPRWYEGSSGLRDWGGPKQSIVEFKNSLSSWTMQSD